MTPDWQFVRMFSDSDGHNLSIFKAAGRASVLLEVAPCAACGAVVRYVLTEKQLEAIAAVAFLVDLPNQN